MHRAGIPLYWVSQTHINKTRRRNIMAYPETYKYTKEHEWLAIDGTTGTIGITDYAQNSLGDIVFVELPKVGDVLESGATFGSIESVKSVSDLFAPVSGTVTEINEALTSAPETINSDANNTWIMKLTLSDPSQADALLDAAAYEAFTAEETGH
jgi:glycine cleavage system H protein